MSRLDIGADNTLTDEPNSELYMLAVLQDLEGHRIPSVIESIETNIQEVKGVIGRDTSELYNLIKRLSSADN